MLRKIFVAMSVTASALNILLIDRGLPDVLLVGLGLLRFFEYYIGLTLIYIVIAYIVTELCVKLDEPQEKPSEFWKWNFRQLADIVCLFLRIKVKVSGEEKLPQDRKYLMVCNHRSSFNPVSKAKVFGKRKIVYISKPSNFRIPIAGKVMHKCGCMPINREDNREALKTIIRASDYIKNDVASVVIYPEGTRSKTEEMLPFHAGSFKIAQRAGAPVVVASITGTDSVRFNLPFKSTKVEIDIIDVLDAEYVKEHNTKEVAELAQSMIQENLDRKRNKESCSNNA